MYPKKTLSAASLLSKCERKRCRSLEARGCAKSESEFSMGTAATCPFIMSEQSPRTIKLFHSVYARSNKPALRQTEIYNRQFMGLSPTDSKKRLTLENGLLPKNPRKADKGLLGYCQQREQGERKHFIRQGRNYRGQRWQAHRSYPCASCTAER